jgi:transposase
MAKVTTKRAVRKQATTMTLGIDLGDRRSVVFGLDTTTGELSGPLKIATSSEGFEGLLKGLPRVRVVIETGTHANWVARKVAALGHEVIVAQSRKVALITMSETKADLRDAEILARFGATQPELLYPVKLRSERAQEQLAVLRARETIVEARTSLIACARGLAKSSGHRLPSCSADSFHKKVRHEIPAGLGPAIRPLLFSVARLTRMIRSCDREVARMCREERPEALRLAEVPGVGELTALAFVLAIDDPRRFSSSRLAGAYFGLVPRKRQSGTTDKQLRITKCGDTMVRTLLVQCAHVVLSERCKDSAIKRWGLAMTERGGRNAKRRAVVAVARKLAVLLHALWVSGKPYEPLHGVRDAA